MPDSLRRFARRAIANMLYYSGVLWLLAARRLRGRAIALMYHRVLPIGADTFSDETIIVTPATFRRHMAFLRRHFRPISVAEAAERMSRGEPLPDMSCLVTFDDGWRDNFEHALPILRESGVPATVFAAVNYIGSKTCFWQERLNRMLFRAVRQGGAARKLAERHVGAGAEDCDDPDLRRRARASVSRMKKTCSDAQIAEFESELAQALAPDDGTLSWGDDSFMSWEQLVALTRDSPVSAAAHGCSHRPLTTLSPKELDTELADSRRRLGEALGADIDAIAYPNGNYDDGVIESSRAHGFRIGFTTDKGVVSPGDDPLRLRRINIHESATATAPEFLCAMLQIFHRLRRS